jgi:hypothetical protein
MKRTRKTRRTFTDAQKRGLVNEVTTLIAQGYNVTEARSKVALKHRTTPISLARWSKNITKNIVRTSNGTTMPRITSVNLHVPGKGNVTLDDTLLKHIAQLAGHVS